MRDEFLAALAHELRNPLAPIRNALKIQSLAGNDPAVIARTRELMEQQVVRSSRPRTNGGEPAWRRPDRGRQSPLGLSAGIHPSERAPPAWKVAFCLRASARSCWFDGRSVTS